MSRARFWMTLASVALELAACGGSSSPPPAPAVTTASIVAPPADPGDLVVAQVNGRPVWGSCVTEQSARGAKDRRAALDECIAFELLAQAAEKRRLAAEPSVREATRTAMVSKLVATEFEDRYQKPADLGAALETVLDKNKWRMHRPELRASTYVRVNVMAKAPPEVDAKARQVADQIAAALASETGLLPPHVLAVAQRIAADNGTKVTTGDVPMFERTSPRYEQPYIDAVFSIPEIGRVTGPIRTSLGWDVILWSGGLPALEKTREELAEEVFPELRRAQFPLWTNKLVKEGGVKVVIDNELLARSEAAESPDQ